MNKEEFFISQIGGSKFIGDDGAFIDDFVYSSDSFFENVHFKRDWMSLEQIARKAFLVNISDAIAMNSIPLYALINISFPNRYTKTDIKALSNSFKNTAKEFNIDIIGGDTIAGMKLDISISIISKTKKPLFRSGIRLGDYIAHTGEVGSVRRDFKKLLRGRVVPSKSRFINPKLRGDFLYQASKYINSAIDISDGLSKELGRLSDINRVGYNFLYAKTKDEFCSGEEYELLFSFDKNSIDIIKSIAKRNRLKIDIFAVAKRGRYKSCCKDNHFV